jgi:hypothetical protein
MGKFAGTGYKVWAAVGIHGKEAQKAVFDEGNQIAERGMTIGRVVIILLALLFVGGLTYSAIFER